MKFDSLRIFKSPLDNNHENVIAMIDDNNSMMENFRFRFFDFLSTNYQYIDCDPITPKSFRLTDIYADVGVKSTFNIFEFNYICFYNKDSLLDKDYQFYFINGIQNINDVDDTNYRLKIQYDVWANNHNVIFTEQRKQYVTKSHISQVTRSGANFIPKPDLKVYNSAKPYLPKIDFGVNRESALPQILWRVYTLENVGHTLPDDGSRVYRTTWNLFNFASDEVYTYGSNLFQYVFVPVCMYNNGSLRPNYNIDIYDSYGTLIPPYDRLGYEWLDTSTHTISVKYTFNVPFRYVIIDGKLVMEHTYGALLYETQEGFAPIGQQGIDASSATPLGGSALCPSTIRREGIENVFWRGSAISGEIQNVITPSFMVESSRYKTDTKFSYDRFLEITPLMHKYPFVDVQLKIGNSNYLSIDSKFFYEYFGVYYFPSIDGSKIYINHGHRDGELDNNYGSTYNNFSFTNLSASLPLSKDQYDLYIRNNGEQLAVKYETDMLMRQTDLDVSRITQWQNLLSGTEKTISRAAKKDYLGSASGATGAAIEFYKNQLVIDYKLQDRLLYQNSYVAKANDLSRMRDEISMASGAEIDTIYQDRVICRTLYIPKENLASNEDISLVRNIHEFGYNVNEYRNLNEFPMTFFSFVQTESCNLTKGKCSNFIAKELEEIINNGVRMWNGDELTNLWRHSAISTQLLELNTDIMNYEKGE